MRLWFGHIMAAVGGALLGFCLGAVFVWILTGEVAFVYVALALFVLAAIATAIGLQTKLPKWERDEIRTGRIPGEKEER